VNVAGDAPDAAGAVVKEFHSQRKAYIYTIIPRIVFLI
jgi:hypothetical protein